MRRPAFAFDDRAATVLVAASTVLGLEAIRVFATQTVWVLGETSNRLVLGLVALGGFAAAIFAWPLARWLGERSMRLRALLLLAGAAVVGQVSAAPWVDFGAGLAGTMAFGWVLALSVSRLGHVAAAAVAFGLAADLAIRAVLVTVDAPFAHEPAASGIVAGLVAIVLVLAWFEVRAAPREARGLWGLFAVGPVLLIFLALSGNFGQVAERAGTDFRAAALAIGAGAAVGALMAASGRQLALMRPRFLPAVGGTALTVLGYALFAVGGIAALVGAGLLAAGLPLLLMAAWRLIGADRGTARPVVAATLGLLAVAVLLFAYYSFYSPDWPLPAALGLAVLAAFAASARRGSRDQAEESRSWSPVAAAIAAAVVFVPSGAAAVVIAPATPDPSAAAQTAVVMTYNIRQGFGLEGRFDLEAVAETIEREGADVVGLQEVGRGWIISGAADQLTWLSRRLDMPYVFGSNIGDTWGNALLTRLPMSAENRQFDNPGRVPRGVLAANVQLGAGSLTVLNTHFDHEEDGGPTRREQAADVLDEWAQRPATVLLGDFNAGPGAAEVQTLLAAGFHNADDSGRPTFASDEPMETIDYVLATPDLAVLDARRPDSTASDHLPVIVEYGLP